MQKKEYFVQVHKIFNVWVAAENDREALEIAYEEAETAKNGLADDVCGHILEVNEIVNRKCKICGEVNFQQGYVIEDGLYYYCSDECLHHDFTNEEFEKAYEEDWAYYTEWEDAE
jgi:hypothetical protein